MKCLALVCFATTLLAAQTASEVEITNEPHHHLVFENKSVRVFNVQVGPNTETQIHWHRHDYIAVTLAPAQISNNVKDKPPVIVNFTEGDSRFASATFAHSVRDLGPAPFRNVTVEILEDATLRNSPAKWDAAKNEDRALEILKNGTAHILFVKDGIRATEFELQPKGGTPIQLRARPLLLIAVNSFDLSFNRSKTPASGKRSNAKPRHFDSGDSVWLTNGFGQSIVDAGQEPAKFVTLEFPE